MSRVRETTSTMGDTIIFVQDIQHCQRFHQHCRGIPSVIWRIFNQYCRGIPSILQGDTITASISMKLYSPKKIAAQSSCCLLNMSSINSLIFQYNTETKLSVLGIIRFVTIQGVGTTYRFIEKQKVEISYEDLVLLLVEGEVTVVRLTESTREQLQNFGETLKKLI